MIIGCEIKIIDILKLDQKYKNRLRIWRNQDFVRKNMFCQEIITKEQHSQFIDSLIERADKKFLIAFRNNIPFGVLYYTFFEKDNSIEFGYYLVQQNDINSGLGIALEYMLLEHAFENIGAEKVFARTFDFNNKVVNIHKKFGFHTENIFKKNTDLDKLEDVHFQSIFKYDWNKKKKKIKPLVEFICPIVNMKFVV
ncbi:UDP-4-amino-4,6-dideoxy-N-acetyl-beta-L-altrosamine N-acetyltransferase [Clostridium sporogenes]|uniref:UDP-4-amino-4, 6-dideoxy-N-acetyl-beta-L-altrosamine N-acetyltransferase n=1 Tax=Clostridium sporogenes TaxID=1509 RepID=UPI002237AE4A|nr:UDP-4-amino-4,6-dideoxy-N-acetyl-beta-L-altrosamine N-acetyltransferase [Clostridium sporogenes]MCW6077022.1 UDP-4-amino-4,6-dideoxy-N-acetyl-beta-L-altrosamine N-acetyltransferase [Clostridium sporogenes]